MNRLAALWRSLFGPRCLHCGRRPESDGDHTCPCPFPDAVCHHTKRLR